MNKRFVVFRYDLEDEMVLRYLLAPCYCFFAALFLQALFSGAKVTDIHFIMPALFVLLSHIVFIIQNRRVYSFCLLDEDGIFVFESSTKKTFYYRWEDFKYMRYRGDGAVKAQRDVLLISVRTLSNKEADKAARKASLLNKYIPMDGVIAFLSSPKYDSSPMVLEAYGIINRKLGHLMGLGEDTGEPEIEETEEFEDTPE